MIFEGVIMKYVGKILVYSITIMCFNAHLQTSCMLSSLRRPLTKAASAPTVRPILCRQLHNDTAKLAERLSFTTKLFSFKDYQALSDKQKVALNALANATLKRTSESPDPYAPRVSHPTLNPDKMSELCEEAQQLCTDHPTAIVIGLGQSPAYLIEAAKALAAQKGESDDRFKHVAFSGSFYHACLSSHPAISGRNKDLYFAPTKDLLPSEDEIKAYRDYLTSLHLFPENLSLHAKFNKRPLIVDNVVTGGGLASFMSILQKWGHERKVNNPSLETALHVRIYPGCETLYKVSYPVETHSIVGHSKTLTEFGHWYNHEENRLVPKFQPALWGKMDPRRYRIPLFANLACFKIIDHIATRAQ